MGDMMVVFFSPKNKCQSHYGSVDRESRARLTGCCFITSLTEITPNQISSGISR